MQVHGALHVCHLSLQLSHLPSRSLQLGVPGRLRGCQPQQARVLRMLPDSLMACSWSQCRPASAGQPARSGEAGACHAQWQVAQHPAQALAACTPAQPCTGMVPSARRSKQQLEGHVWLLVWGTPRRGTPRAARTLLCGCCACCPWSPCAAGRRCRQSPMPRRHALRQPCQPASAATRTHSLPRSVPLPGAALDLGTWQQSSPGVLAPACPGTGRAACLHGRAAGRACPCWLQSWTCATAGGPAQAA